MAEHHRYDTRCAPFPCPVPADPNGIAKYRNTCPYAPAGR
jgi:hypothetical protein